MQSSTERDSKSSAVIFCWTVCWVILPIIIINNIFSEIVYTYQYTHACNYHKDFMLGTDCALEISITCNEITINRMHMKDSLHAHKCNWISA